MTKREEESPSSGRFESQQRSQSNRKQQPGTDVGFGTLDSDAARRWSSSRLTDRARRPQSNTTAVQGGEPPDDDDTGGDEPTGPPFDRRKLPWIVAGACVLMLIVAASAIQIINDQPETVSEPTPTANVVQETIDTPTIEPAATDVPPEPTATIPVSTPTPTPIYSALAAQCQSACLIRSPVVDQSLAILGETGERPSYASDTWLWTVASRDTIARLDVGGVPVTLIRDTPDTLHLYLTRLPEGQTNDTLVREFGQVLDSVDGHAIVSVDQLPAKVTTLAAAGIWVEKLAPDAPAVEPTPQNTNRMAFSDGDLSDLVPQVSDTEIERTIYDLQQMSSTDGTGIGTRHYTMPGNVMASEYLFRRLESYGLKVWYEDFITPEGLLSTNIVGEIPGRDASAIYGVMAHFDSYSENLSSAPGADDNATGVAAILEIARILIAYDLEHPVHVILVNAEESGVLGSAAFARNAVQKETPYEGVYNLDAIGSDRQGALVYVNSDQRSAWMMDLLIRINDGYGLGQDMQLRQTPGIVADDTMLRDEGIESVLIARELFGQGPIHHTTADVAERVSISNTVSATQLILLALAALVVA